MKLLALSATVLYLKNTLLSQDSCVSLFSMPRQAIPPIDQPGTEIGSSTSALSVAFNGMKQDESKRNVRMP
jgi:hypothetical protein